MRACLDVCEGLHARLGGVKGLRGQGGDDAGRDARQRKRAARGRGLQRLLPVQEVHQHWAQAQVAACDHALPDGCGRLQPTQVFCLAAALSRACSCREGASN